MVVTFQFRHFYVCCNNIIHLLFYYFLLHKSPPTINKSNYLYRTLGNVSGLQSYIPSLISNPVICNQLQIEPKTRVYDNLLVLHNMICLTLSNLLTNVYYICMNSLDTMVQNNTKKEIARYFKCSIT